jgi:sugar lactone lactonase YvrE
MNIGTGPHTYTWLDNWARIPCTSFGAYNGRTHGVVTTSDHRVVVFNQARPGVLILDQHGKLLNAWGDHFPGAHGLTISREADGEFLWLADQSTTEVVKTTLDGRPLLHIQRPPHDIYKTKPYVPTWVAVHPGSGDVWVTDGYGSSHIHRHDKAGKYIATINGSEGAGEFRCPHGIGFGPDGLLYVADRGNHRITVYDHQGKHLKHNDDVTHSPCMFDFKDGLILVPELFTGVKLLDMNLKLVAELGANPQVHNPDNASARPEGWPNLAGTPMVKPGFFNSPHGACFGPDGSLYVAEWIIGGRITKLVKA